MLGCMGKRMSAAKWGELVAGWESSGRSAEEFASEHGISGKMLRWWKTELARRSRDEARRRPPRAIWPLAEGVALAEVARQRHNSAPTSRVAVVVGTTRILIEKGFDGQLLREVVRALGESR
jgi:hypothetical protein